MIVPPDPNKPLRLADAVTHGFPGGGMTVSGRRREIARGGLVVEVIAGKQFTTLTAIEAMRRLCLPTKTSRSLAGDTRATPDGISVATAAFHAIIRERQDEDRAERLAERAARKGAQR